MIKIIVALLQLPYTRNTVTSAIPRLSRMKYKASNINATQ